MNQDLIKDCILNCKQKLLTYNPSSIEKNNSELSPLKMKVIGKKAVGKSYFIRQFCKYSSNKINGIDYRIEECTSYDGKHDIPEDLFFLFVIINSNGINEQKYISTLNASKPQYCLMVVILNYYTIRNFERIHQAQNHISTYKNSSKIDINHMYWTDDYSVNYLLINENSSSISYSNQHVFFHLINHLSIQMNVIGPLKNHFKNRKGYKELDYDYYKDEINQKFVIEMPLNNCNRIINLSVQPELIGAVVSFVIQGRYEMKSFRNLSSQAEIVNVRKKINILYCIASLSNFKLIQLNEQDIKDGILLMKFDVIDTRFIAINPNIV